jgi:hypothetical protein
VSAPTAPDPAWEGKGLPGRVYAIEITPPSKLIDLGASDFRFYGLFPKTSSEALSVKAVSHSVPGLRHLCLDVGVSKEWKLSEARIRCRSVEQSI